MVCPRGPSASRCFEVHSRIFPLDFLNMPIVIDHFHRFPSVFSSFPGLRAFKRCFRQRSFRHLSRCCAATLKCIRRLGCFDENRNHSMVLLIFFALEIIPMDYLEDFSRVCLWQPPRRNPVPSQKPLSPCGLRLDGQGLFDRTQKHQKISKMNLHHYH